jgi:ABC-type phosphate/phosphonate transport system substrate-binding protein
MNTGRLIAALGLTAVLLVPQLAAADYRFSAPPRESVEQGEEMYGPIAEFLSQATGVTFQYEHPQTWTRYTQLMQDGQFDLVFDGSHFVSWRLENAEHEVLAKLPQRMVWRIVGRKDDARVRELRNLIGLRVCAPHSPNLGMLTLFSDFPNPVSEPVHVAIRSWRDGYDALLAGRCHAAVMPAVNHEMFDPGQEQTVVLREHAPMPNQAFTAGPKLSPRMRALVREALLSPGGQQATAKLRERFSAGRALVVADPREYRGVSSVLNNALGWGIYAY